MLWYPNIERNIFNSLLYDNREKLNYVKLFNKICLDELSMPRIFHIFIFV